MADTQIEWTDATWNPVAGCSIESAGCTHCYAMQLAKRLDAMVMEKYAGLTRKSGERTIWNGKIKLDWASLEIPKKWRKPRTIFVNSMSDLFHPDVPINFIKEVWATMAATPRHNYQILTKRPERMAKVLKDSDMEVLNHLWLGTSVESADVLDRIASLTKCKASIRFISFEPLIGPVGEIDLSEIDWAIVGGESGSKARPIKEAWIDQIYDQCNSQEVAFFFKQWGTWGKDNKKRSKKANGRLYRGQHWDEMPNKHLG